MWLLAIAAFMVFTVIEARMQLPCKPPEKSATVTRVKPLLAITVSGAVACPGVYKIPRGSTIQDALQAAGGALPHANLKGVDLKQKLTRKRTLAIKALKTHPDMS